MPIVGITNAAAGGRWTPAKPSMSYRTTGQFNTVNYSTANTYILVPNTGTATMDASGIVSLSAIPSECTIRATSPKGGSLTLTAQTIIGRAPYSYTYTCYTCSAAYQDAQGNYIWVLQPYGCGCVTSLNGGPAGYTNGTNEWQRIVN